MSDHVHRWIFPPPNGLESTAKCKYCGDTQVNYNSVSPWRVDSFDDLDGPKPRRDPQSVAMHENVLKMLDGGNSMSEIETANDVTNWCVFKIAKARGRRTPEQLQRHIRNKSIMYELDAGDAVKTVAARYDLGIHMIYHIQRKHRAAKIL